MVAELLKKLAAMLRSAGSPEKKQKLRGLPNPGSPAGGIPNPVGSRTEPPKVKKASTGEMKGWKPKIPTTWRKL
jgi:hypothetical protein